MNKRHVFVLAFVLTVGVITWGDIKECHELPWPPRFVGAALVFFFLDLFSMISEDLASVMTVGVVIAAIVNKGFTTPGCNHTQATAQPASYQTLQTGTQTQGQTLA